jgi:hypothetical protein
MANKARIEAWNYTKKYAKKVESLDFLDVFGKLDEDEWEK